MSDPNTSPVSLPAGAFDLDKLGPALDKAAKGSAKNYGDAVASAFEASRGGDAPVQDMSMVPGFKLVDRTLDDLGSVETVQVFDPKLADKQKADQDPSPGPAPIDPPTSPADAGASQE